MVVNICNVPRATQSKVPVGQTVSSNQPEMSTGRRFVALDSGHSGHVARKKRPALQASDDSPKRSKHDFGKPTEEAVKEALAGIDKLMQVVVTEAGAESGDRTTQSVEILDDDLISKLNQRQVQDHLIPYPVDSSLPISRRCPSINRSSSSASKYGVIVRFGNFIEDKVLKLSPDTMVGLAYPPGHNNEHWQSSDDVLRGEFILFDLPKEGGTLGYHSLRHVETLAAQLMHNLYPVCL